MKNSSVLLSVLLSVIAGCANFHSAQVREKVELDKWQFCPDTTPEGTTPIPPAAAEWAEVRIPHVFRLSGLHEQSAGWYRCMVPAAASEQDKRFYLFLEGAGSVADVFVNGRHIGQHRGAFTAAAFDLTDALDLTGDNVLTIRVTNRDSEAGNCLSQSNLYYTNGGLYRPVWLIKTSQVHIYPDMGSTGVYLTAKNITPQHADLEVRTYVKNCKSETADVVVRHTLIGPDGKTCGIFEVQAAVAAGAVQPITAVQPVKNPQLWDIHQPNLYTVQTEILADQKLSDMLTERTGFRTIAMD
ncbi:MAG TPA: beta galactosidase jelly roll domain-containing protein, partial [Anaerohalosphaeraceae bacterium]|nr:beta galactosidase jelly roll domain-containing protein [Anaerohalosphaeraceae bacterium]